MKLHTSLVQIKSEHLKMREEEEEGGGDVIEDDEGDVIDQNVHFYVVAILLSILKLLHTWLNMRDFHLFDIDQGNVMFLIEIVSIPLSVVNPSVWFAIFMTSLANMSILTDYPTFSLLTVIIMFFSIYSNEFQMFLKKRKNGKKPKISNDDKPLVDMKLVPTMV